MSIQESQLTTWSHQGSVTQSSETYQTIRKALLTSDANYSDKSFDIFLQGSYGNDTNIYVEADVDVVIRLDSIFRSNIDDLSPEEQQAYHGFFPKATYSFSEFKAGVFAALMNRFGNSAVKSGNKAIKIKADSSRRSADVVVCYQYRYYKTFDRNRPDDFIPGIIFPITNGYIINYPKKHSDNLTSRHQSTKQMLKPMIRILKNMRSRMVDDGALQAGAAPSYFIEGLFYNVPPEQYATNSFGDTFCNGINWILNTDCSKMLCTNERYLLLGKKNVQWNAADCDAFLAAVCQLWKDW